MNSLTDTSIAWPPTEQWLRVFTLADYNTRVVVLGTMLLGVAAGVIGSFMLLRKRALMGDALSHATLPGIGVAYLIMTAAGGTGRWLPGLLAGATASGLLGMGAVLVIRGQSRLKEDAALGIVLSVFFGLGVAILGLIQQMTMGHAAGLESFIYGKTASMLARDAWLIGAAAAIVIVICAGLFKEFTLLCFDSEYASAGGWPVMLLDVIMMALVVFVTVIGLQAVGLILMIALLIIPPAAARFWTHRFSRMVWLSALIGATSGLVGAGISALLPRLPAGAIIVVVAGSLFLVSMIFGTARGVLRRALAHWRLERLVERQHLLRALYEWHEARGAADTAAAPETTVPLSALRAARSWSSALLRRALARARHSGLVRVFPESGVVLSPVGWEAARRVVRNHRLWETYLITHADIAPFHVDRNADAIEHVLEPAMIASLESLLARSHPARLTPVPPNPHPMQAQ